MTISTCTKFNDWMRIFFLRQTMFFSFPTQRFHRRHSKRNTWRWRAIFTPRKVPAAATSRTWSRMWRSSPRTWQHLRAFPIGTVIKSRRIWTWPKRAPSSVRSREKPSGAHAQQWRQFAALQRSTSFGAKVCQDDIWWRHNWKIKVWTN